jgi:hypothetical protein
MPTVTLVLRSQRGKPVTDRVEWCELRGRFSGRVHPADIVYKPASAEIVGDLVPDLYTIDLEVPGFEAWRGTIDVTSDVADAFIVELDHRCTLLPKVSDLLPEQRRLLGTLDALKTPGDIWHDLSDNKAATFYQVSYALAALARPDGAALSELVDGVVVLGGSELIAPDPSGTLRTVVGWRMHVRFVGTGAIDAALRDAGFKRDGGTAHTTHSRFGFKVSYREKSGAPKMQVTTDYVGAGADVDIDAGAFHRSSPRETYKAFAKRFPDAAKVYKVKV